MPVIDFSHLSREERLQLIEELWESLGQGNAVEPNDSVTAAPEHRGLAESGQAPLHRKDEDVGGLTPDQLEDMEQRLATLDEDRRHGRPWDVVRAEIRGKYL